jgi:hypothetical protein
MTRFLIAAGAFTGYLLHGDGLLQSFIWAVVWYVILTAILFLLGLAIMALAGTSAGIYLIWSKITGKPTE